MTRYARQSILPEVGAEGQSRLAKARVLVVGAGGLAAPVLPLLAGAGVGHVTIVDGDTVDLSNLHRQTLFTEADCGQPKATIAAQRCIALNSEIEVVGLKQSMNPLNATALVDDHGIVLDCADSYAASYILSDTCRALGKPLISASVLGFGGYVGGFCGGSPSLRAVFPDAPDSGASCATAGVLGPVVGVIGAMQAQMTLAVILDLSPSPLGQVVQLDASTLRSTSFRFDSAPEPDQGFTFAAPDRLGPDDIIVDLRDTSEAPTPAHPRAVRLLPGQVAQALAPSNTRLALCCASGLRAWREAETLSPNWPGEIVLVATSTS